MEVVLLLVVIVAVAAVVVEEVVMVVLFAGASTLNAIVEGVLAFFTEHNDCTYYQKIRLYDNISSNADTDYVLRV